MIVAPLRVGIVGCGWVAGTQVAEGYAALSDRFRVTACADADQGKARRFAEQHRIPAVAADLDGLLLRDDVDVVSICTPPFLHFEMVIRALRAGKHVICEKPLTSSLARTDQIIAAEQTAARRVMPIFQYRFFQGVQKIRHLIRSGLPGNAYTSSIETAWRRDPDYYQVPWRGKRASELGGVLLTQSIHIHDLFLWLMGPIRAVKAFKATRVNPIEVEDCAVACLEMADGSLATLTATLGSLRPVTRMRLCFEAMTIERQAYDDHAIRPGDDPWEVIPTTPKIGEEAARLMAAVPPVPAEFAGQFSDFADALDQDRPFAVTLNDARRSLELITALFHSAETGETVLLPIMTDHPRYHGWIDGHG